jgi:HEAT repeat protein
MLRDAAWSRLEDAVTGTKNTDTRVAAISALSILGGQQRAERLVGNCLHDPDIDVRLAAIVAAGELMKNGSANVFSNELRNQLNDQDPKVVFTTASTLWKLDDPSGEDILLAVAEGERSGNYNFWKDSTHQANRTLHSPVALMKIAAQQSVVILVPPVGIGMGAYNYLKGPGGVSPQITAIYQIGKERTNPAKIALIEATRTKDPGARLSAAEALGNYRGEDVTAALRALMNDGKENVRLTANAAYIRQTTTPGATSPTKRKK